MRRYALFDVLNLLWGRSELCLLLDVMRGIKDVSILYERNSGNDHQTGAEKTKRQRAMTHYLHTLDVFA